MTTPTTPSPPTTPTVPLAVWPVAQTTAQYQRAGRYLPGCTAHPGKMLPELARRIVTEYSSAGQVVVDPLAGIGTTVVEAALLDRRAVGVELENRWVTLAKENLDHMLPVGRRHLAEVRAGDARRLPEILGDLTGTVDLIVTSPPYGCDAGVIDKPAWLAGGRLCPAETLNYSSDRANIGHARGGAYEAAMAEIYAGSHPRPCRAHRRFGERGGVLLPRPRHRPPRGDPRWRPRGPTLVLAGHPDPPCSGPRRARPSRGA